MIITKQPELDSVNSAYLPLILVCNTNSDIVYCDVYVDGVKRKTLSKSVRDAEGNFVFDIKDILQEEFSFSIPDIGYSDILDEDKHIKSTYVELYSATLSKEGEIQMQNDNVKSAKFYVANIILQHEEGKDLLKVLDLYKTGQWDNYSYPLTKRPEVNAMCVDDNSFFPILTESTPTTICITAKTIYGGEIKMCRDLKARCPDLILEKREIYLSGANMQTIVFNLWGYPDSYDSVEISYKDKGFIKKENAKIFKEQRGSFIKITVPFGVYDFSYVGKGECLGKIEGSLNNIGEMDIPLQITWEDGGTNATGEETKKMAVSNIKYPVGRSSWSVQNGNDTEVLLSLEGVNITQIIPLKTRKNTVTLSISYEGETMTSNEIYYTRKETSVTPPDKEGYQNIITTSGVQYLNGGKIGSKVQQWQSPNPNDDNTYYHELEFDDFDNRKTYTIKQSGKYKVKLDYSLAVNSGGSPTANIPYTIYMSVNGEKTERLIDRVSLSSAILTLTSAGNFSGNIEKDLKEGDVISFFYYFKSNGLIHDITATASIDILK